MNDLLIRLLIVFVSNEPKYITTELNCISGGTNEMANRLNKANKLTDGPTSIFIAGEDDIFAKDKYGGVYGFIGGTGDLQDDSYPIGYVCLEGKSDKIANSFKDLLALVMIYGLVHLCIQGRVINRGVNMEKKRISALALILCIVLALTSCTFIPGSNKPIKHETMVGDFVKTESDTIIKEYKIKVTNGFFASMDFDIKEGRVDWEIIDPKGNTAFAGYVISEKGSTYRQLTEPSSYLSGRLSEKEVANGESDFHSLQFESDSPSGTYKLNLKPKGAEGNYKIIWSDRMARK
jgi:hypothetical protein